MDDRRAFLKLLAAAVATTARPVAAGRQQPTAPATGRATGIKKSTLISMLPRDRPYAERFAIAREAGSRRSRCRPSPPRKRRRRSARPRRRPACDPLGDERRTTGACRCRAATPRWSTSSVQGMETSLRNAALWGADAVLLVPAVVDAKTSYRDAWTRSQRVIRERLLPMARDLKVVIAVEEVWNKFLLSPIEFARYVDEFESPWVQGLLRRRQRRLLRLPAGLDPHARLAHRQGPPEGLQARSAERPLHLEEPSAKATSTGRKCAGRWRTSATPGYVTTEICKAATLPYLKDVSSRVDRILAGEKPVT